MRLHQIKLEYYFKLKTGSGSWKSLLIQNAIYSEWEFEVEQAHNPY